MITINTLMERAIRQESRTHTYIGINLCDTIIHTCPTCIIPIGIEPNLNQTDRQA